MRSEQLHRATEANDPKARYVVFRCFDETTPGVPCYGSLDLREACHPQTLLAHTLEYPG